jgi:hypothetical protein
LINEIAKANGINTFDRKRNVQKKKRSEKERFSASTG